MAGFLLVVVGQLNVMGIAALSIEWLLSRQFAGKKILHKKQENDG